MRMAWWNLLVLIAVDTFHLRMRPMTLRTDGGSQNNLSRHNGFAHSAKYASEDYMLFYHPSGEPSSPSSAFSTPSVSANNLAAGASVHSTTGQHNITDVQRNLFHTHSHATIYNLDDPFQIHCHQQRCAPAPVSLASGDSTSSTSFADSQQRPQTHTAAGCNGTVAIDAHNAWWDQLKDQLISTLEKLFTAIGSAISQLVGQQSANTASDEEIDALLTQLNSLFIADNAGNMTTEQQDRLITHTVACIQKWATEQEQQVMTSNMATKYVAIAKKCMHEASKLPHNCKQQQLIGHLADTMLDLAIIVYEKSSQFDKAADLSLEVLASSINNLSHDGRYQSPAADAIGFDTRNAVRNCLLAEQPGKAIQVCNDAMNALTSALENGPLTPENTSHGPDSFRLIVAQSYREITIATIVVAQAYEKGFVANIDDASHYDNNRQFPLATQAREQAFQCAMTAAQAYESIFVANIDAAYHYDNNRQFPLATQARKQALQFAHNAVQLYQEISEEYTAIASRYDECQQPELAAAIREQAHQAAQDAIQLCQAVLAAYAAAAAEYDDLQQPQLAAATRVPALQAAHDAEQLRQTLRR